MMRLLAVLVLVAGAGYFGTTQDDGSADRDDGSADRDAGPAASRLALPGDSRPAIRRPPPVMSWTDRIRLHDAASAATPADDARACWQRSHRPREETKTNAQRLRQQQAFERMIKSQFGGGGRRAGLRSPPPNDTCDTPVQIIVSPGQTVSAGGTTIGATADAAPPCGVDNTSAGVWYAVTLDDASGVPKFVTASLCNEMTLYDTKLTVYCGNCAIPNCVEGTDDVCDLQSEVSWCAMGSPTVYYVLVHGFGDATGDFQLDITADVNPCMDPVDCTACDAIQPPMSLLEGEPGCGTGYDDEYNGGCNSDLPDRFLPIECDQVYFGTSGTWTEDPNGGPPPDPNDPNVILFRDTDWYELEVDSLQLYTFTVTAEFPVFIAVLNTGGDNRCSQIDPIFPFVAFDFADACDPLPAEINVCLPPGRWWFFVAPIAFYGVPCGREYTAGLTCTECPSPPENDDCVNAEDLVAPEPVVGTTIGATLSIDEFGLWECGPRITAPGVWYRVVGAGKTVRISTCSIQTDFDTRLSVFCGTCDQLYCIGGNDDQPGLDPLCDTEHVGGNAGSTFEWCAENGRIYYVLVHGRNSRTGHFELSIQELDTCSTTAFCEPCTIIPDPGAVPEGEPLCSDSYVDEFNGGCNSTPPVFSPIDCGDRIQGRYGTYFAPLACEFDRQCPPGSHCENGFCTDALGLYRDTDWYELVLDQPTVVSVRIVPHVDTRIGFLDTGGNPDCGFLPPTDVFLGGTVAGRCTDTTITTALTAGTWWLFVAPKVFIDVSCGSQYNLSLDCAAPPANDRCQDAEPVLIPSITAGTTEFAAPDDDVTACVVANTSPGVWYLVTGTGTTITASLCNAGTTYDSKLSVYCAGCDLPVCVAGDDDTAGCSGPHETVSWCSQLGAKYLILVHGNGGASGDFALELSDDGVACAATVECLPKGACCLPDDSCTLATPFDCAALDGAYLGDNTDCGGESYVVLACTNELVDISGNPAAQQVHLGDDAAARVAFAPGFSFRFYGMDYSDVWVTSNGYIAFTDPGSPTPSFFPPIPNPSAPNLFIAALGDDLDPSASGRIDIITLSAPSRFIVQWKNVPQYGGSDANTFQIVLYEDTGEIQFRYQSVTPEAFPGDYTVGTEDAAGTDGVSIAGSVLTNGLCLSIVLQSVPDPCKRPEECPGDPGGTACDTDINGDCLIDSVELQALLDAWGKSTGNAGFDPRVDYDRNGTIDGVDLQALLDDWGHDCRQAGCPNDPDGLLCDTDVNGDCLIDSVELQALVEAWGKSSGDAGFDPRVDYDSNGVIDGVDLQELLDDWANNCQ